MSLHFLMCLASWLLEWFLCASCLGFWNGFCAPRLCLDFGNGFGVPRVLSFGVVASWLWDELGCLNRVLALGIVLMCPASWLFVMVLVCHDRVLALGWTWCASIASWLWEWF